MVVVKNVKDYKGGLEKAIKYIHGKWGNEDNYLYFHDAIMNSALPNKPLPQFFLLLNDDVIIGCCGLIVNDFISRHDLYPWVSSLYVNKEYRGNEYGNVLMTNALNVAKQKGFSEAFLTTSHNDYYEKYGWVRIEDGIDLFSGKFTRIYNKSL